MIARKALLSGFSELLCYVAAGTLMHRDCVICITDGAVMKQFEND